MLYVISILAQIFSLLVYCFCTPLCVRQLSLSECRSDILYLSHFCVVLLHRKDASTILYIFTLFKLANFMYCFDKSLILLVFHDSIILSLVGLVFFIFLTTHAYCNIIYSHRCVCPSSFSAIKI